MAFVVVEQQEPHAGRMAFATIDQPTTFTERCELARRIRDELEVPLPIYVDGMDDASRALFSDLPSPAFVIDRDGRIADKLPWADPELLAASLATIRAADVVPSSASAALTLDQRDALGRRALADGRPERALAWIDTPPDEAPCVPPTLIAVARLAISRCHALGAAAPAQRTEALRTAGEHTAAAWPDDPPRLVAAWTELAELAAGTTLEADLWRAALRALEVRAPAPSRAFLQARLDAVGDGR